jgi:hypothetical protein
MTVSDALAVLFVGLAVSVLALLAIAFTPLLVQTVRRWLR